MPKYKVGDVAALFPKPSVLKTDTGGKIQSLFDEFYKNSSKKIQKPNQAPFEIKKKKIISAGNKNNQVENQSEPKKKRKYHDTENSEDISEINIKKAKKFKNTAKPTDEFENVTKNVVTNEETYFPRNKKSKNFDSMKENTALFSEMSENDTYSGIEDGIICPVNSENHQVKRLKKKKNKSDVDQTLKKIKKAQLQGEEIDTSVAIYTFDKMLDKVSIESPQKKQKKAKNNNTINGKANENRDTQNYNEKDEVQFQKTNNISSTENKFDQKRESEDRKKLSKKRGFSIKQKETTKLSRTLFVGNLPMNMSRKMLKRLFVPFGLVETCRLRCSVPTKASIPKKIADIKNEFHVKQKSRVGYVVFKDGNDAAQAMFLNGVLVGDHRLVVNQASEVGEQKLYDKKRSIFIGNLPYDVDEDIIWTTFAQCGTIEAVRTVRDWKTRVGKGFGYVLFQEVQSKKNALALENVKIADRIIRIKEVQNNPEKSNISKSWSVREMKAMKIKKQREKKRNSRKTLKKIMKKENLNYQKKKCADIFKSLSA